VSITLGSRVGAYTIVSLLGQGGMGVVYRAHDTKLNRDVALKVLLPEVAENPERLARFRREAQILASLNHANIAHIYGLEEADGVVALVLELVEGPTLADRIAKGAIPLDEALPIARQIAEALEAVHEQGIIHRDLKPANIKVREDCTVKVLDFGLAKAMEPVDRGSSAALANSPTITSPALMTSVGVLLGTAAYMSPEQAKGRPADKRSDIWAFGCVLYEMLTGTRAFKGEDVSDTLAAVLRGEPDWSALPPDVPPALRTLIRRAVQKDPKRRIPDIGITRLEIDEALAPSTELSAASVVVGVPSRTGWHAALPWAVAAAPGAGLAIALWAPWRTPPVSSPVRLSAEIGADVTLDVSGAPGANLALSPNGKLLVFAAQRTTGVSELYIRRVDQLHATSLSGTDNGRNPFFSPDGQWIGFFAGNKLKKVSITGGAAVTLSDAPTQDVGGSRGGAWRENGTIVFQPSGAPGASLLRVSDGGGKPEPFTTLANGEGSQRWPQLLPGGKAVLFTTGYPRQIRRQAISSSSRFQTVYARLFSVAGTTAASCPVVISSTFTVGRSLRRRSTSIVWRSPDRLCRCSRALTLTCSSISTISAV
jgi:serine/threonine-protein kinase